MNKEEQIRKNHILDLARTAYMRGIPTGSDFLTPDEQSFVHTFEREFPPVSVLWEGGYEMAERKRIAFLPDGAEFQNPAPLCVILITPQNRKYAEELTHRDFLGALLNLGIDRGKIGDLLVTDEGCYVICLPVAADLMERELSRVRHTSVQCRKTDAEQFDYTPRFQELRVTVASLRLDCVAAAVMHVSRGTMVALIAGEKVAVNGRVFTSASASVSEGDRISVRGYGKFCVGTAAGSTRKGRIPLTVLLYS